MKKKTDALRARLSAKQFKELVSHCDAKIEAFWKEEKDRAFEVRIAQLRHMTAVEKYLENMNKILEKKL